MQNSNFSKKIKIAFAVFFIVMTVLTFLTPICGDDFIYSFNDSSTVRPLNLYDIYFNMTMQRVYVTARVVSHFLVELFLMLPKYIFNIINGIVCTITLYYLFCFVKTDNKSTNFTLLLLCISLLWVLMPVFGQIFFWLDGSINYGWCIALILSYLYPFYSSFMRDDYHPKTISIIAYALFAVILGAYSENGSLAAIGISAVLIVLMLIYKKRPPVYLFINLILAICGYVFLMTAPVILNGNKVGGSTSTLPILLAALLGVVLLTAVIVLAVKKPVLFKWAPIVCVLLWIVSLAVFFREKPIMLISSSYSLLPTAVCLYAAIASWGVYKKINAKALIVSFLLFIAGICSILVFALAIYFPARSSAYLIVFIIIGTLIILREFDAKLIKTFRTVIVTLFVMSFILGCADIISVHFQTQDRMAIISQAQASGEKVITLNKYHYYSKYTALYGIDDIGEDPSMFWINRYMADYYYMDTIYGR